MAKTIDIKLGVPNQLRASPSKISAVDLYINHTKTDRRLRSLIDKSLSGHDISLMDWLVLSVVVQSQNGLSMGQIASKLDVSLPGITVLVNQLKDRHLIIQKTDRQDRRQRLVSPSAKGRALLRLVKSKVDGEVGRLLKPIPANYLVFYKRVVEQIYSDND